MQPKRNPILSFFWPEKRTSTAEPAAAPAAAAPAVAPIARPEMPAPLNSASAAAAEVPAPAVMLQTRASRGQSTVLSRNRAARAGQAALGSTPPSHVPELSDAVQVPQISVVALRVVLDALRNNGFAVVQYATCGGSQAAGLSSALDAMRDTGAVADNIDDVRELLSEQAADVTEFAAQHPELFELCMPAELVQRMREAA